MCIRPNNSCLARIRKTPNKLIKAYKVLSKDGFSPFWGVRPDNRPTQKNTWGPGFIFPSRIENDSRRKVPFDEIKNGLPGGTSTRGLYLCRNLREARSWKISTEKIVTVYVNAADIVFANAETFVCSKIEIKKEDWKKVFNVNRKPIKRLV